MASSQTPRRRPTIEPLENRLALSVASPASAMGTAVATLSQPGRVGHSPALVSSANITAPRYPGHVGQMVLGQHKPPIPLKFPLTVKLTLAPTDQVRGSHSTVSGAATYSEVVTILGHTTPGSLVIEDNHVSPLPGGTQAYKFTGPRHTTDASGFFSIKARNSEGLNNNNFLIVDPFGQRLIADIPIYWIPFAAGRAGSR